jgi:hypothetical protein
VEKKVIPREVSVVEGPSKRAHKYASAGVEVGVEKGKPFPCIQSGLPILKIQRKSLSKLISFCNTCIQVNWADNDHAVDLGEIKEPIETLYLKIDDFIIQEWKNKEINVYGHEEKAEIVRWISSRLELNPEYRENIAEMMKQWRWNFQNYEENLAHRLVRLLIKSNQIIGEAGPKALLYWCNNAKGLQENGGLMDLEEIGPICVTNLCTLLVADEDLQDRPDFVDFFKQLTEADVEISESQLKVLATEEDPWDVTDPEFDVAAVRKGHSLILSFADGKLEEESWNGEIASRKITTRNMYEPESNNSRFIAIITRRDVENFESVFDKWVPEDSLESSTVQSLPGNRTDVVGESLDDLKKHAEGKEILKFIQTRSREILEKYRVDFDDDDNNDVTDMYYRMSYLATEIRAECESKWKVPSSMHLSWRNYIRQVLNMRGFKACIEADEYLKPRLKYRQLNQDEFHSVRLRDEESDTLSARDSPPLPPSVMQGIATTGTGKSAVLIETIAAFLNAQGKGDEISPEIWKTDNMKAIFQKLAELREREDKEDEVDEGEEKTRAEIEMDRQIEAITTNSLTQALVIVSGKVSKRAICEKKLLESMNEQEIEFSEDMAKSVIKQFELTPYSNTIGMRTRSAWIKHLKFSFENKFSKHSDYENLLQIVEDCE